MKLFKIILFSLCLLFITNTSYANSDNTTQNIHTITIEGSSNLSVEPDTASINIGISTNSSNAKTAQENNAKIVNNIYNNLYSLGLSKSNIETANYNFSPMYDNENNKINGYSVNNTITITTNNTSSIGEIIDASLQAGANQVNSITFSRKNATSLKQEALKQAVADAKNKANAIAKELNVEIINVISVNEQNVSVYSNRLNSYALKSAEIGTTISSANVDVSATVNIVFEIK